MSDWTPFDPGRGKTLDKLREANLALIEKMRGLRHEIHPLADDDPAGDDKPARGPGAAWRDLITRLPELDGRDTAGRGLLRNHALIDLRPGFGTVAAQVSDNRVLRVALSPAAPVPRLNQLKKASADQLNPADALDLHAGRWPATAEGFLLHPDDGVLPVATAEGLEPRCGCGDSRPFCKHVLCVMYGLALRLDQDPTLLLRLCGINPEDAFPEPAELLPEPPKKTDLKPLRELIGDRFELVPEAAPKPRAKPAPDPAAPSARRTPSRHAAPAGGNGNSSKDAAPVSAHTVPTTSEELEALRESLGLTPAAFAMRLRVPAPTLAKWLPANAGSRFAALKPAPKRKPARGSAAAPGRPLPPEAAAKLQPFIDTLNRGATTPTPRRPLL